MKDSEITTQHINTIENLRSDFVEQCTDKDKTNLNKLTDALDAGLSALRMNRMAEQESENDPDGDYDPV